MNIKVNISTRLLAYFLFVTILPLFFLAWTSAWLLQSSLNDKLNQELSTKSEFFWKNYNDKIIKLKNDTNNISTDKLGKYLTNYDSKKNNLILNKSIRDELKNIAKKNNFDLVFLFDQDKNLIFSNINKYLKNNFEVIKNSSINFKKLIDLPEKFEKQEIILTTELISLKDLLELTAIKNNGLNNTASKELGFLAQIGLRQVDISGKKYSLFTGYILDKNSNFLRAINNSDEVALAIVQNENVILSNLDQDVKSLPIDINENEIKFNNVFSKQIIIKGEKYRSSIYILKSIFGEEVGEFIIGIPEEYFDNLKLKNSTLIFEIALLVALAGVSLAYLLARTITVPLSAVTNAARAIENGDFSKRVNIKSTDEIGYLAQSFNSMASTLQDRNREILAYNELLLEQNKKIEAIINSSADGIITLNKNWEITSVNQKIIKWTDLSKSKILGKLFYEIIDYKADINFLPTAIDKINNLEEFSLIYPNAMIKNINEQDSIDLDITYAHIKFEQSSMDDSYVLILRDITRRKESDQIKENFVATLTHDLRVPLLANVQTLEYLLKGSYGDLSEKQKFIAEQLISSNKDLLRMVNIILDSYKYEAGKQTLVKRKINLNKLIDECILEIESLAKEKKHEIIFMPEFEATEIIADRQELKRVIINLLSNAIIYTQEKGMIEICTKSKKDEIIVSIKDNGTGISESSIKNLFERYSKGTKTLRKIGTGLGLYLSKHIIEAHNGKIWVESTKDKGSIFYFSIPGLNI
ncbi:MAG: ATP-binding protein [bacterium]